MKLMKVFDCQDMPDDVRESFFDYCASGNSLGNDCYVDWYSGDIVEEDEEQNPYSRNFSKVVTWLVSQGATVDEHVIIKHWW